MTKQEIKRAKNNLRKIQAQVWLKKRKKLRFVLSCVAVIVLIYFSWNLINKADIHLDSTTIGVAGTLFGAVIGGLLTLAGSIWVYSKEQRAKQNVKRKNLIYSPLYDELQTIYDTVFAKNYYPPHADFSKEKRQYHDDVRLSAWERIKMDTRYLETPDAVKNQMELLCEIVQEYDTARQEFNGEVERIFDRIVENNDEPKSMLIGRGRVISKYILSEEDKNLYKEITLSQEETEVSKKIDAEVREAVENSDAMKHLKDCYAEWKTMHEQTTKLIASLIEQVLLKYEG